MWSRNKHDTDADVYMQPATNVPSETQKSGSVLRSVATTRDEISDPKHQRLQTLI